MGRHQRQGSHFLVVSGNKIVGETKAIDPRGSEPWSIDQAAIREFLQSGLGEMGTLFEKEPKSQLEQAVFDALLLYSKGALVSSAPERLMYIFAALESVLLRNDNESITQNLGERLGFLVGTDADSRLLIKQHVAEAYGVRSSFIHHGRTDDDCDLTQFLLAAWDGLHALLGTTKHFKTKEQLLDEIERRKMS
jgi:hypothetical protein